MPKKRTRKPDSQVPESVAIAQAEGEHAKRDPESIEPKKRIINGVEFVRLPGVRYRYSYDRLIDSVEAGELDPFETYRHLLATDPWFFIWFCLKIPIANHPFVIGACREFEEGPESHTLDVWAREHFKSTIITVTGNIQRVLRNPNETIGIFSYNANLARKFVQQIKWILESDAFLKATFPDVLYEDPEREARGWAFENGLFVKRETSAKEPTFSGHGLIDGMPTGFHLSGLSYDDVLTPGVVDSPEMNEKSIDMFDLSLNLGSEGGWQRVAGTFYHDNDALRHVQRKVDGEGKPLYHTRIKPATKDGEPNGEPVFISQKRLDEKKSNKRLYYCQQLCNPSPQGTEKLDPNHLKVITREQLPKRLYKFMVLDAAGGRKDNRVQDNWAILLIGVEPFRDDRGASSIYILDAQIEPLDSEQGIKAVVQMYERGGRVLKIGVEKVALSTTEVHVANALRAKGKFITVDNGRIHLLSPAGRKKETRIEDALQTPFVNGKIHVLDTISPHTIEKMREEMRKFPFGKDDFLDATSYIYDIIKDYRFPIFEADPTKPEKPKRDYGDGEVVEIKNGWMVA